MGFQNGIVVAVSGSATLLCAPRAASAITVQNVGPGAGSATVGGPTVTAGAGINLAIGALPLAIQATHFGNVEDADDGLYVITSSGTATIAYVHGF
jgi:hypothetical protein